jgi:hypothetical protein
VYSKPPEIFEKNWLTIKPHKIVEKKIPRLMTFVGI